MDNSSRRLTHNLKHENGLNSDVADRKNEIDYDKNTQKKKLEARNEINDIQEFFLCNKIMFV
jgi:hypothetical protein